MKILGYVQLRNEEVYARASIESIRAFVDELFIVFDRCTDETMDSVSNLLPYAEYVEVNSSEEVIDVRKSLFTEFEQFDWIMVHYGDEIYEKAFIKDMQSYLLVRAAILHDVYFIKGATVHVLNEAYNHYTLLSPHSQMLPSCVRIYNNNIIGQVISLDETHFNTFDILTGPRITFDISDSVSTCPINYHMHNLVRTRDTIYSHKERLDITDKASLNEQLIIPNSRWEGVPRELFES